MSNKVKIFLIIYCLTLPLSVWAVPATSPPTSFTNKEPSLKSPVPLKPNTSKEKEGIDLIVILDCSGSMKKTDPQDLRKPATQLIVSLLSPQDRIGLVSFGSLAQTLIPLTDDHPSNHKQFSSAIQKISSEALYTNLNEAVRKGFEEIKGSTRKTKILLLMSDGQMDLGAKDKDEAAIKELYSLISELTKLNIKLYTVAFTDLSDQKLLADLAERTKGLYQLAKTDKDLHLIFSSIFEQVKHPDEVPLEGNTFLVDKDIQEVTVLITKQVGTTTKLVDPNHRELIFGKVPDTVNWFPSSAFDLITIKSPFPGRWTVQLSSKEGNKVFVVTDLALKTSLGQNPIVQGRETPIEAWLERENNKIVEKRFLDSIFFMAEIKDPKGLQTRFNLYPRDSGDQGDTRGVYSHGYAFKERGTYTVKIAVDGKTFKRELVRQVKPLSPAGAGHSSESPVKSPPPTSAELWAKAIKNFLMINGLLIFLAGLGIMAVKWQTKRAATRKK